MSKNAFIFPGQGAQYPGMGKEFYDNFLEAREIFERADDILSRHLSKLIFSGSLEELTLTSNSQPAIFVTSMAILRVVEKQMPELTAELFGGLSLGEYTAITASQKLDFETCLRIVALRGDLMQKASDENPGVMMAVLGLTEKDLTGGEGFFWIANINSPGQIVVACRKRDQERVEKNLVCIGAKRVIPLKVSGAFHTPLMNSAKESLRESIENAPIQESDRKLVMNVVGDFVFKRELIKHYLIEQVSSSTRWLSCLEAMKREAPTAFIEIGPGQLTAMNRKTDLGAPMQKIETIKDMELVYASLVR